VLVEGANIAVWFSVTGLVHSTDHVVGSAPLATAAARRSADMASK
jgi:hypothetical protein